MLIMYIKKTRRSLKRSRTTWAGLGVAAEAFADKWCVLIKRYYESFNNVLMRVWKPLLRCAIGELREVALKNFRANVVLERREWISRPVIPMLVAISLPWSNLTGCPGLAVGKDNPERLQTRCEAAAVSAVR